MEKKIINKDIKNKIYLLPIWVIFGFISYFLIRIYVADVYYRKSQRLIENGSDTLVLESVTKAVSLNPYEPNYYRGKAKILVVRFLSKSSDLNSVKLDILDNLKKAYSLNPNNLVTIRNSIPLYYFLSVKDINLPAGVDNIDSEFSVYTVEFFNMVKSKYWNDTGVISSIAKYEKQMGLDNEYEVSVERIKILRPDLLEWNESFR